MGGYPPSPLIFVVVKNRPKNCVFWAKNAVFGGFFNSVRYVHKSGLGNLTDIEPKKNNVPEMSPTVTFLVESSCFALLSM